MITKDNQQIVYLLGVKLREITKDDLIGKVLIWARNREKRYICFVNVHMIIESYEDKAFRMVLEKADILSPDGMPIAWWMRRNGFSNQERLSGPDVMNELCRLSANEGIGVGLLGGTKKTLEILTEKLKVKYPKLNIVYKYSPPFRKLKKEEMTEIAKKINSKGVQILFVGLGCPKQEKWMYKNVNVIHAVQLGVGAAFDFNAGLIKKAPKWIQSIGMEWFFRFIMEPKRLWKRYLLGNSKFIYLVLKEILRKK